MTVSEIIEKTSDDVLLGLVMKLTGGSANPNVVTQILARVREEQRAKPIVK
jgi:Asp-tRNA(Asn)/Glu-tRNA(Gln) amidotransferase B subunit